MENGNTIMISLSRNNRTKKSALSFSGKILLGASSIFISHLALSDATVTYEQVSGEQKSINTMQIKEGKIRFTPPNQSQNFSLYDSETGTLTHVDTNKKKYLAMDENAIAEQANQAKKQMEIMRQSMMEKMKDMPPEQKKQVEQMMNNHLSRVEAEKNPETSVQKTTSRTETIAGIECTIHESFVKEVKVSELCITEPDKMGLDSQDAKALMAMQGFMKRMQKVAQAMMGNSAPSAEISGIPLHTKLFTPEGSVKLETRLSSISSDAISSDQITVPADFTPMAMPGMPGMK